MEQQSLQFAQMPQHLTSSSSSHRSRFSVRFSLSSFLGGSSIYSNSPRFVISPPQKQQQFSLPLNSTRDARNITSQPLSPRTMRSRSSTRSLIDPATVVEPPVQPLDLHGFWYGAHHMANAPQQMISPTFSATSLEDVVIQQDANRRQRHRHQGKRRYKMITRRAFREPKVRVKASMASAFGITLLASLALCKLLSEHSNVEGAKS